jgi:anti-sigma B factor antagonist
MSFFCISEDTVDGGEDADDIVVLTASGEIDFAASSQFRESILDHANSGERLVVVDLSTVTFIDSTAIGVLVGIAVKLQKAGRQPLAVVCAEENRRVLRIFDIAGVANVMTVYPSCEEALSALVTAG